MQKCCTQAGNDIKIQKSFRSPDVFEHTAKHPEGKHIEEQMPHAAMHKQVSNGLPEFKFSGARDSQAE